MAYFKLGWGNSEKLANQKRAEGHAWITVDDGKMYFDKGSNEDDRIVINAEKADQIASISPADTSTTETAYSIWTSAEKDGKPQQIDDGVASVSNTGTITGSAFRAATIEVENEDSTSDAAPIAKLNDAAFATSSHEGLMSVEDKIKLDNSAQIVYFGTRTTAADEIIMPVAIMKKNSDLWTGTSSDGNPVDDDAAAFLYRWSCESANSSNTEWQAMSFDTETGQIDRAYSALHKGVAQSSISTYLWPEDSTTSSIWDSTMSIVTSSNTYMPQGTYSNGKEHIWLYIRIYHPGTNQRLILTSARLSSASAFNYSIRTEPALYRSDEAIPLTDLGDTTACKQMLVLGCGRHSDSTIEQEYTSIVVELGCYTTATLLPRMSLKYLIIQE